MGDITSKSTTYLRGKIGGQKGRPPKKSNIINIGTANQELPTIKGKLELAYESTITEIDSIF